MVRPKTSKRVWHWAHIGFLRCSESSSLIGALVVASSFGNAGMFGGGGGMASPSRRETIQWPRFTGLVRRPGEFCVRNTAIGIRPPRSYLAASSIFTQVLSVVCESTYFGRTGASAGSTPRPPPALGGAGGGGGVSANSGTLML